MSTPCSNFSNVYVLTVPLMADSPVHVIRALLNLNGFTNDTRIEYRDYGQSFCVGKVDPMAFFFNMLG